MGRKMDKETEKQLAEEFLKLMEMVAAGELSPKLAREAAIMLVERQGQWNGTVDVILSEHGH